jgi:predicted nucleic acid-binding protein
MTRILLDVNVVLDVLLNREPHVAGSAAIWALVERGSPKALLAAHAVTTIHYLVRRQLGTPKAEKTVTSMLTIFAVAAVDEAVIRDALGLRFSDFEDAVTAAAAYHAGCDCIVTRDPKGFRNSPVRALTPEAAFHLYSLKP